MSSYILELILAILSVLSASVATYFIYRKREITLLAIEIIVSYEDKNISKEEYGRIVQKLKNVVCKK